MIKIDQTTPQDIMITKLDSLISKTLHYQKKRPRTNIMAVEHINNGSKKYNYSFRVHVLVNEIVSYYVITGCCNIQIKEKITEVLGNHSTGTSLDKMEELKYKIHQFQSTNDDLKNFCEDTNHEKSKLFDEIQDLKTEYSCKT